MSIPLGLQLKEWNEQVSPKWGQVCLLIFLGLFSFTYNLHVSLIEGTEGLYAQVVREMLDSGEYFRLTFQGQPYINKPPIFFWMVGGLTQLFGENEISLRLTGSLFSLGTMILTFFLGRILFSWNVGFWAAFIFATNHLFLFYGRRVLIDSTLTFFITLALLGWVLGNRKNSSSAWYVVTFLGMALGALAKGLHGFWIPLLIIVTYSILLKDFRAVKRWGFWVGLILFMIGIKVAASWLGPAFQYHYGMGSLLLHASNWPNFGSTGGSFKLPSYLHLVWFDLFPWSVLIPTSVMFLISERPFRKNPAVLFILLWFLGYFLVLCFSRFRREPYLMPLVPAFALTVGYYLVALSSTVQVPRWHRLVNGAAFGILTITVMGVSFFGPSLLRKKWNVPLDLFPPLYIVGFVTLCGFLVWIALKGEFQMMRRGLVGIGFFFAAGLILFFFPAVDAASSPKMVSSKIRAYGEKTNNPLYHFGITQEDLIYYLNAKPVIPRLMTYEELIDQAKQGTILIVTDKKDHQDLIKNHSIQIHTLQEFPQPRGRNFLLLSIAFAN